MTRQDLMNAVVEALELKGIIKAKHFYQGGGAVQITTLCGDCFNIYSVKIKRPRIEEPHKQND